MLLAMVPRACGRKALVEVLRIPPRSLVGEKSNEELLVGQLVVDRLPDAEVEGLEHAAHAELLEERNEIISEAHGCLRQG